MKAVFSILSMREGVLPPTLNLNEPDDASEGLNLVPLTSQEKKPKIVLSNSFGFGGTNASLLFAET